MPARLEDDPLWYKDAIIYELHVKTFFDSNGDGKGDFRGLTEKLDYLEYLGVTAIWLLPFYPSPLKDDGYDISDYFGVNPEYGNLRDFREFLRSAHARGIRVITELVLNHTSDQHAWFQKSRKAVPGSAWRKFYVWSQTPEKYRDARIIFGDFESSNWAWDSSAKAYYWHRFYSHQPDLNFDYPQTRKALSRVIDFWMSMGVDGMRLDAVPYLFEREGTNCENLPETYEYLRSLRRHMDASFKNRMLLAEANQWPEDAAAYFGSGDICNMAFHFPLMPRIFMAVQMEDRFPIIDILEQTPNIPENCQWSLFLRNHDELTLEMVTDEERDYMYRVYARDPMAKINLGIRRRLAPLMQNNRRKIELMNVLLLTLPGTPVIYYGDEIGMGDNFYLGDRNGVRTPMQWSPDKNAGFSRANPQMLYLPVIIDPEYHYEALNVENQMKNASSLLWWMKRSISARKRFKAFGRGDFRMLSPTNNKVLAFTRQYGEETILVVVNLSRFSQVTSLDLSGFTGCVPEDIFSQNRFPAVREKTPYVLTLGAHWYHLFIMTRKKEPEEILAHPVPRLSMNRWEDLPDYFTELEGNILPGYLASVRWFGGKGRALRRINIIDYFAFGQTVFFIVIEVNYVEGLAENFQMFLKYSPADRVKTMVDACPQCVIARAEVDGVECVVFDAVYDEEFRARMLDFIRRKRRMKTPSGELYGYSGALVRKLMDAIALPLASEVLRTEQTNTAVAYEKTLFMKFPRKMEAGPNPDLEIVKFLTEKTGFKNSPPFAGAIEYMRRGAKEPLTIALLNGFVQSEGDAWSYTIEDLKSFYEAVQSRKNGVPPPLPALLTPLDYQDVPVQMKELVGGYYFELVEMLGKRTAQMHAALFSGTGPDFAPEPFSLLYQRSIYQSMRSHLRRTLDLLRANMAYVPEKARPDAVEVLNSEERIIRMQQRITQKKINTFRFRIHGDFHLGQVLYTGKDFCIIDFEGEPARALSERRIKKSPFRDVAGMVRSFHYAIYRALFETKTLRPDDIPALEPWGELWFYYISAVFLKAYLDMAQGAGFLPGDKNDINTLLDTMLMDKAVYELAYEINSRPDWVSIPLKGIKMLLRTA
ncbi:MAG: maltose alpha-D-glucosyltransferase [Actinomycetota bacterium]|nr:maltose alpha-D-glucosyltransferase [Actinomycetota bacterium]